jgi:hydroxyethylthiazole kinase
MSDVARHAAEMLARVRERRPRVHCITNTVVQGITANALLAIGAVPSMTIAPEEIGDFVASADALLINLGTFDAERRDAVEAALDVAHEEGVPWLLDPVLIDRSPPRATYARALAAREPRIVRANAGEFAALIEGEASAEALDRFALKCLTVAARTGADDLVTDGAKRTTVSNGHPFMALVTGIGCAETALMAALNAEGDAFAAAVAGLLVMGIAGELAGGATKGPGTFAAALIDVIHGLDATTLVARARLA